MVLLIDNYDSFVHNLARYFRQLGAETRVERNDALSVEEAVSLAPGHLVVSPGPRTPRDAGISAALVAALGPTTPTLGVCLGHQCIAAAYGGEVVPSPRPTHGRASPIRHTGEGIFAGLPQPMTVGRYHSLSVPRASLPWELEVAAETEEGEVMAVRHREHPVWGVQFHPESVLTEHGHGLLRNFLALRGRGAPRP